MQVLKLICGVSSNDNRLIPFAIFSPNPYVDPVCVFLPNVYKPDFNRIREMVSFELGKEIEKDVFCPVTSVGKRKNSESGMRNRTSNLRIPRLDALPLSHEDSTVSDIYYEVHMTSITKFIVENPIK